MTLCRDPLSPHRTGDADFSRPALLKTLALAGISHQQSGCECW